MCKINRNLDFESSSANLKAIANNAIQKPKEKEKRR